LIERKAKELATQIVMRTSIQWSWKTKRIPNNELKKQYRKEPLL
jgi:hypothetical protein